MPAFRRHNHSLAEPLAFRIAGAHPHVSADPEVHAPKGVHVRVPLPALALGKARIADIEALLPGVGVRVRDAHATPHIRRSSSGSSGGGPFGPLLRAAAFSAKLTTSAGSSSQRSSASHFAGLHHCRSGGLVSP